jgi:multiple antibiotic resistance protein
VIELFTTAFITLVVIIDPPGCAPIFASLTSGTPAEHRRRMAIRSCFVAWAILMFFALLAAGPLMKLIGAKVEAMITRILGVILAALAAQFVIDGLRQSFPSLA